METVECTPSPTCLAESLRSVGYSMETAIADIIDNSISAQATAIDIFHDFLDEEPVLAILDNGHGMNRGELIEAMRPGGHGPLDARQAHDLGRFGLGLKTASFSQCRKLTVISRRNGMEPVGACWDLDRLHGAWQLSLLGPDDIQNTPFSQHTPSPCGTLVIWEKLDRITANKSSKKSYKDLFLEQVASSASHVGLVFHRFIEKEYDCHKVSFRINKIPVTPLDPYFSQHDSTQKLQQEDISLHGSTIAVKPYIIPHYSKLDGSARDALQKMGGANASQGVYVYRNNRLLARGGWLKLKSCKKEAYSLARVSIDIPNCHDDLWNLDIKKSSVSLPELVRAEIDTILERILERSIRTYTSKGQKLAEKKLALWVRLQGNKGASYALDRSHPLLDAFSRTLDDESRKRFDGILRLIEKGIPWEAIYNDRMGNNIEHMTPHSDDNRCEHEQSLIAMLRRQGVPEDKIRQISTALDIRCEQDK